MAADNNSPEDVESEDIHKYNNSQQSSQMEIEINERTVNPNKKVCSNDFQKLSMLGKGGYGKVFLVKKVTPGSHENKFFAMKELKKARIIQCEKDKAHTLSERSILETLRHPFLVKMQYAFQTNSTLHLVLEYCPGGELFRRMEETQCFSVNDACFYTAEVTLAIGHLHSLGIIYRDLKPENILLDRKGHIKLTDFGLSKEGVHRTNTFCGTIDYMAPEIIEKNGHDKAVDWWSLGALLYDMLSGGPPFTQDGDKEKTKDRILNGEYRFPSSFSAAVRSFITALLKRNPHRRLGNGDRDVEDIKDHEFFKVHNVNWGYVMDRRVEPPYVPQLCCETDVSEFDPTFTSQPAVGSPDDSNAPIALDVFKGFSYCASLNDSMESTSETEPRRSARLRHGSGNSTGRLPRVPTPSSMGAVEVNGSRAVEVNGSSANVDENFLNVDDFEDLPAPTAAATSHPINGHRNNAETNQHFFLDGNQELPAPPAPTPQPHIHNQLYYALMNSSVFNSGYDYEGHFPALTAPMPLPINGHPPAINNHPPGIFLPNQSLGFTGFAQMNSPISPRGANSGNPVASSPISIPSSRSPFGRGAGRRWH